MGVSELAVKVKLMIVDDVVGIVGNGNQGKYSLSDASADDYLISWGVRQIHSLGTTAKR